MPFAPANNEPPFYLLTQPLANSSSQSAANFAHPVIECHFADDPPSNLLPRSNAETVVILDYDDDNTTPVARSLHHDLSIAGLKVSPAPGAGPLRGGEPTRNNKMYIIETLSSTAKEGGEAPTELDDPQHLLAQFRERNILLTRVLDQPTAKPSTSRFEATESNDTFPSHNLS